MTVTKCLIRFIMTCVLILCASVAGSATSVSAADVNGHGDILPNDSYFTFTRKAFNADPHGTVRQFSRKNNDIMAAEDNNGGVGVSIIQPDGHWWRFNVTPPPGESLFPGIYPHDIDTSSAMSAMSISGREACYAISGHTEILTLIRGPRNRIEEFRAVFDVHCAQIPVSVRGEVWLKNSPRPPLLELGAQADPVGNANPIDGFAKISGTLTCTKTADIALSGTVSARAGENPVNAKFSMSVPCKAGEPARWAKEVGEYGAPFLPGPATLMLTMSAFDIDRRTTVVKEVSQDLVLVASEG